MGTWTISWSKTKLWKLWGWTTGERVKSASEIDAYKQAIVGEKETENLRTWLIEQSKLEKPNRRSTLAYVDVRLCCCRKMDSGKGGAEKKIRTHTHGCWREELCGGGKRRRIAFAHRKSGYSHAHIRCQCCCCWLKKHKLHQKLTIYMYNLSSEWKIINVEAHTYNLFVIFPHALVQWWWFIFRYTRLLTSSYFGFCF